MNIKGNVKSPGEPIVWFTSMGLTVGLFHGCFSFDSDHRKRNAGFLAEASDADSS